MPIEQLENLLRTKPPRLKKEKADRAEFETFLREGKELLADASKGQLALGSQFRLAYEGVFSLALAALRWHGYRPDKIRHVVFDVLQHTVGLPGRDLRYVHDRRNDNTYEAMDVDEKLVKLTMDEGAKLLDKLQAFGPPPIEGR